MKSQTRFWGSPFIPPISMTLTSVAAVFVALYAISRLFSRLVAPRSQIRDLPGPPPQSWATGNLRQLFNAKGLRFHQSLTDVYGGIVKIYGFFGDEQLYIADPQALQHIILREPDAFEETAIFTEQAALFLSETDAYNFFRTNKVIFGPGLVATTGEQHARQRRLVTPIFGVPHLRQLVPVFYRAAERLADVLHSQASIEGQSATMDMSEWMSRVALESVGQTVLGYSFDPLDSPHNNPYTAAIKELIPTLFSLAIVRELAPFLAKIGPPSFRRKLVEWTPHNAVQRVKNMADVMHKTAQDILERKREEMARDDTDDQGARGKAKDIISILLRANEQAKAQNAEQLSDLELTGQMTVLIFGAQDTTASCLSRVLYQLAQPQHRGFQDKIRREIQMAKLDVHSEDGVRLDYDALGKLPILDAVLKETLRLFPPVPFVRRSVKKETLIPYVSQCSALNSDVGGTQEMDMGVKTVRVPAGTILFMSIMGANRLESVWGTDAKEWNPERWLEAMPSAVKLPGVFQNMMSFLGGGRSCVGYKFALLEMKIILAVLISRFAFSTTQDEIVWNLSQIISPSIREKMGSGLQVERKGMPLIVESL
ncbi:hypothetical protein D9619_003761 [Psilocybe cf. subviscida]|uniref:Cytochrome P450 n=1 Tax=Psilocybe cf. subviscida TaxID=2480587 RepID=A0A8H5AY68_9AGAR|nr:hypothetical protein D9619_003761 [Psilocybe cf. subviscida]